MIRNILRNPSLRDIKQEDTSIINSSELKSPTKLVDEHSLCSHLSSKS